MVVNNNDNDAANHIAAAGSSDLRRSAVLNYAALALLGIVTGFLTLLLGAAFYGLPLFFGYFSSPFIILLNILPPVLLILLVYFITGRVWISYCLPALLLLLLAMIGFFKLQIRTDPFVAADLLLISETGHILSSFNLTLNWKIFFVSAVYICCSLLSIFVLKYKEKKPAVRITGTAASLLLFALLYNPVYTNTDIYTVIRGGFEPRDFTYVENYVTRGFIYPFIHSIKNGVPEVPEGYSEGDSQTLLGDYHDPGIPDDKKVNIISIMLEAYADLSQFGVLEIDPEVYAPLHKLQDESISGSLIVNVFGGGTIDTERLFLTGFTRLINYSGPTNSYVHYLNRQGYYTEGFHAGDNWFYDRVNVNKFLGFQNYYYLEDYEDSSRWDSFFFPTVKTLYDARDREKPYFSYNLSYQNHGSYDSVETQEPYLISADGLSGEAFCVINNYLTGIYDTNMRISELIDSLRGDPDPVVVVLFGDHMPWLGNYESIYKELGINTNAGTEEGFYNYYSTPYVIWANDAAKELLNNDFTGDGGSFSPCFLMGEVFRLCSWPGEGYMQALREIGRSIDIINTPTGIFRTGGELTYTLPESEDRAWQRFKKIEYYRFFNFFY